MKPNGYTIWEGPSLLDGSPIVVIATGYRTGSTNRKTGSMIQTWILRADMEPHLAIKSGADSAICGACSHRGAANGEQAVGRSCYVLTHNAPLAVYRAWKRGVYPDVRSTAGTVQGRVTRVGSYGDPAAVPAWIWETLLASSPSWTGYTHAWRTADMTLQQFCMASVDSPAERTEAKAAGWRTFHVAPKGTPPGDREIVCPASDEGGHATTCDHCKLCQGTSRGRWDRVKDVVIQAHGAGAKHVK